MTIDELEDKSLDLAIDIKNEDAHWDNVTELSIQFTIETLEDLKFRSDLMSDMSSKTHGYRFMQDKIQELKEYLNEEV